MHVVAVLVGMLLVASVLVDLINTLVTTHTSQARWWLSRQLYLRSWPLARWLLHGIRNEDRRDRALASFAPVSVLLLLITWVAQQILGFALIWWGLGGVMGADGFADSLYYSGVVYFTLGFGEVVPVDQVPRFGALVEAFSGVLTTALVIGYLPALYGAFSQREQMLLTLDDGTEDRITPTELVISRSPGADPDELFTFFAGWEAWVAQVMETHSTFPMLVFFRSQQRGQSWVTALGLITDAALHCQIIRCAENRAPYWMLRRSIRLFAILTEGADLSGYRRELDEAYGDDEQFRELYARLEEHGFELHSFDQALAETRALRRMYDARLEFLIDYLDAPRGFWGHSIGQRISDPWSVSPPT